MSEEFSSPIPSHSKCIRDITLPFQPGMPVWPGDPEVVMNRVSDIRRGDLCNVSAYHFGSHTGTHLDPPLHFYAGDAPLHEIPLSLFLGPCFVADLTSVRQTIRSADLDTAAIPPNTERLLLKTSNSRLWADPFHAFEPDFVDLSPEGAEWVIRQGIRLIGIDYLSIERPQNEECLVHRSLLAAPVVILEGLDLREIEAGTHELICLPLKAMNGDGAPARVILLRDVE
jgi:arylformamidase